GGKGDVRRLGAYTVNNSQFAEVDDEGLVVAAEVGETAIMARFERTFAATGVIVLEPALGVPPSGGSPDADANVAGGPDGLKPARRIFQALPVPQHFIDGPVVQKLNRLKITPSPAAGDEEFLRRAFLPPTSA